MNFFRQDTKDKSNTAPADYQQFLSLPVEENSVLFESGQGGHANGNPFAIACELAKNPKYKNLRLFYTVRPENMSAVSVKFRNYGLDSVTLLLINSPEYNRVLATAKYLVNDNSFPVYFIKREEQIYINTWHGTPIKRLGRADVEHASSIGNVQKNFSVCDHLLFPNEYTRDIFFRDYMLDLFKPGNVVLMDYPRNAFLMRPSFTAGEIPGISDAAGKTIAAYMPTWRRCGSPEEQEEHNRKLSEMLTGLDKSLTDDTVLLLNLHFLETLSIDLKAFKHIRLFPEGYDPYDVLAFCDILITDYSSVLFDYAVLNRKIILFAYDSAEYAGSTGFYFPLEDMGFPIVSDIPSLVRELKDPAPNVSAGFSEKFCSCKDPSSPEKTADCLLGIKELSDESMPKASEKRIVLYYAGDISDPESWKLFTDVIKAMDMETEKPVLVFRNTIYENIGAFLRTLPEDAGFIRVPMYASDTREIEISLMIYKTTGRFTPALDKYYRSEQQRFTAGWKYDEIRFLSDKRTKLKGLLEYILREE